MAELSQPAQLDRARRSRGGAARLPPGAQAGRSEVKADPKDTKDHPVGVWALPPISRMKDQDRAKFAAIGESDRFTLKLVRQ